MPPDPGCGDGPGSTGADAHAELNITPMMSQAPDYGNAIDCLIVCASARLSYPWECPHVGSAP